MKRKLSYVLAAAVLTGALSFLVGCTSRSAETPDPVQVQEAAVTLSPESEGAVIPAPEAVPTPTPDPTPEPTPTPAATPEPRAERVDDDYFADAAFFGNSLMDGLHRFGGMSGNFFAGTSASILTVEMIKDAELTSGVPATMLDAMLEKQYTKIYTLFGINELGFDANAFGEMYGELLNKIAGAEPEAEIYVLSLTPITEKRSQSEDLFTKERVLQFNEVISAMAAENGYTYIDLYTPFADENGWLAPGESSDGVHFTTAGYQAWAEFMHCNYDGGPKE